MSNSSRDNRVPGCHYWYIKRLGRDANKWPYWVFVQVTVNGNPETVNYVPDQFQATPFRTREEAEAAAFNIAMNDPELLQKLKVELV